MKKLFLLIPILAFTLMANAKILDIAPNSPQASDNVRREIRDHINAGDTLRLADGTYTESESIAADKNVVIIAADGASPIVQLAAGAYIKVSNSANVVIKGVKFDGATNSTQYAIRAYDASASKIRIEDCEFYGFVKYIITSSESTHTDSLFINNCYFHNNIGRSAVYFPASNVENQQTCLGVKITNSTFANNDASNEYVGLIDVRSYGLAATDDIEVLVDHCTFYNNITKNSDYASVNTRQINRSTVSNCIFAHSEAYERRATYMYSGSNAINCLTFNLTKDASQDAHTWMTTRTGCFTADPLFNDLANNKYTFAGNWVTMELSPARGAATDGSDLGAPRWYSDEVLPSTDFATPYQLTGDKALLNGNIWYDSENDYLYGDGAHNKVYGTATWKIHAEKACIVEVARNLHAGSPTVHKIRIEILDADGNSVGEFAEQTSTLPGTLVIPAEGDYTITLNDDQEWSSAQIDNITLSYIGGDVQTMPGTTNISDAWFSEEGTRADGKIDFPDGHIQDGWVKWNVSFADAANYNVTVNIDNANGHWYTVALYRSESDESPITVTEGKQMGTIGTLELGAMEVPAGNYILKVTNATQYSDAKLISVNFAYAGGAAVDLSKTTPASLLPNADAILSDDWTIEDGKIVHAESKALTGWAKWNVNSADDGNYNVTVNISSDNGHLVQVEIFEDENEPAIYTLNETATTQWHTGEMAIDLGNITLDNKEYVFKVSNTQSSSHVQIVSIVITYKNGAVQNIPGALTLTDAMLSGKAYIENDMLYFAPHDCGTIPEEWAKWNLHVADADVYQFAVNVTSPNGQKYTIIIEDKDGNEVYNLVQTSSLGSGDRSFTTDMMYLASGDYTLEMRNNYPYSDGHLVSISAAAVADVLTIDENATDNSVIYNNYRNGNHTIRLIRTIKAGMYNTICLPFDVSSSKLQAIFGSDVELKQMSSAVLNGNELDLIFEDATSIYRGTPYLIKTSSDVVNPIFTEVEIKAEVGDATSGTNADFIGNFIKSEVPAGENNLFLGPENLLYFSQTATPIKGMRAYFQLKGINHPQQVIKHARIVMNSQVATAIELVNGANNGSVKTIENGQLIIIRDGVRYNAMGAIIK